MQPLIAPVLCPGTATQARMGQRTQIPTDPCIIEWVAMVAMELMGACTVDTAEVDTEACMVEWGG